MIDAEFEFDADVPTVVAAFLSLPPPLRPVHFSSGERASSKRDRVDDVDRFSKFIARSKSGFFLLGPAVTYSLATLVRPIVCDCFIDVAADEAVELLVKMSVANPMFGYACEASEREHRNRIVVHLRESTVESWVGRDMRKYVPGFYWLTLLSGALGRRHGVSLDAVAKAAIEHVELPRDLHLFRFYKHPEDWRGTDVVDNLCGSTPGVFDLAKIAASFTAATNYADLHAKLARFP